MSFRISPPPLRESLIYTLFFAAGFILAVLPAFGWNFTMLPGSEDTIFNSIILEHGYQWLGGLQPSFWDAPFFHPAPNALAYSDSHLGNLPIFVLLRSFMPLFPAVGAWIISQLILNFSCCVWVMRRWGFPAVAAAAGAYVFTFALPVTAQFGHIQLLPRFAGIIAAYFLKRFWDSYETSAFIGFIFFILWQFACSIYLGAMFTMLLLLYLATRIVMEGKKQSWRRLCYGRYYGDFIARLAALAVAAVFIFRLLQPYRQVWQLLDQTRPFSIMVFSPPQPLSFLLPNPDSPLYHWLWTINPLREMSAEHALFPGVAALVAVVVALSINKKSHHEYIAVTAATAAMLIFCIAIGPFGLSTWCAEHLPGMNSLRSMSRVILVLLLPISLAVAAFVTRFEKNILPLGAFILLLFADTTTPAPSARVVPSEYLSSAVSLRKQLEQLEPGSAFLYLPATPDISRQLAAMRVAQELGLRTVNGYSGHNPPGWFPYGFEPEHYQEDFLGWMRISYRLYATEATVSRWHQPVAIVNEVIPTSPATPGNSPAAPSPYPGGRISF